MPRSSYGSVASADFETSFRSGGRNHGDRRQSEDKSARLNLTICGTLKHDDSLQTRTRPERDSDDITNDGSNTQHCHANGDTSPQLDKKARMKLIIASVLCLVFMTGEIVGGILANSLAIATDAAHLLTDFASFMISLFAIYLASRPATKSMSFGWHRAEVMGALISVLMIWVVTGVLVYMAIERVISGVYEIDSTIMLIVSGIGIAFNLIMLFTLHDTHGHSHGGGHGHSHGGNHGHSNGNNHGHSKKKPANGSVPTSNVTYDKRDDDTVSLLHDSDVESNDHEEPSRQNLNVRAAFIHVLGDLLQSVGVMAAALIIYFKPEYKLADPICTFLFSVLVLATTITILKDTIKVLMEGTPSGVSFTDVKTELCQIPGVEELHNLRIWSLTTSRSAVAVHLAIADESDPHIILSQAGEVLREKFGINECTIQTEKFVDEMKDCTQCQDPLD